MTHPIFNENLKRESAMRNERSVIIKVEEWRNEEAHQRNRN